MIPTVPSSSAVAQPEYLTVLHSHWELGHGRHRFPQICLDYNSRRATLNCCCGQQVLHCAAFTSNVAVLRVLGSACVEATLVRRQGHPLKRSSAEVLLHRTRLIKIVYRVFNCLGLGAHCPSQSGVYVLTRTLPCTSTSHTHWSLELTCSNWQKPPTAPST